MAAKNEGLSCDVPSWVEVSTDQVDDPNCGNDGSSMRMGDCGGYEAADIPSEGVPADLPDGGTARIAAMIVLASDMSPAFSIRRLLAYY